MARDVEKTTPFNKDDKSGARKKPDVSTPVVSSAGAGAGRKPMATSMFHNFELAKHRKMPKWAVPLLSAMLLFHVVLFLTMWVKTIWDIEQLERPKNTVDLAIAPPPPPPPPPPKGGVKPHDVTITPKKVRVRDIVQPVKIEKKEEEAPPDLGDPNGVEGGVAG